MIIDYDVFLAHHGMPRRSGRYPYGSGKDPYQHAGDFLSRIDQLKKEGFSWTDEKGHVHTGNTAIAKGWFGISTGELRAQITLANNERGLMQYERIEALKKKGFSRPEIAEKLGLKGESTVRSIEKTYTPDKIALSRETADFLKAQVDSKGMIDVGTGVERELHISREKLNAAIEQLKHEGYVQLYGSVPQITNPGRQTNLRALAPPGTPKSEIYDYDKMHFVTEYTSDDDGKTFRTFKYPESMNSKRLAIRYAEEGGLDRDGLIEIRRGKDDLSLGESHYAQVRILVDKTHYLKGMAVYSDDLPDGVDVRFNTNKSKGTPALGADKKNTVLKKIKDDPDNPFGSAIKPNGQSYYIGEDGKRHMSLINKRAEEGDWDDWSKAVPSQFLAKQNKKLVKSQLNLTKANKQAEFDEIMSLTNPAVKRMLLQSFSDDCDSAAIHLKAAALPRQRYQVILPVPSLKKGEVYAPNYENGEKVALVRFPHGGTFEIPILTVNNKNREGRKMMSTSPIDAVGIDKETADRLSGADWDGDTVMVVPTGRKINITSTDPLTGLQNFDPKMEYPYREGMRVMSDTQNQMGRISNLITDMTIKGATPDELAKAVRHSMVVIDAEKHSLDYVRSEVENDIATLKKKYQGKTDPKTGRVTTPAATLLSRAKNPVYVDKKQGSAIIDPETGKVSYKVSDKLYEPVRRKKKDANGNIVLNENGKPIWEDVYNKDGTPKMKRRTQESTQMAETDDAYTLSSGSVIENYYADYANSMKRLANESRKAMLATPRIERDPEAAKEYKAEVDSLKDKINDAALNAPKERRAQMWANAYIKAKEQENPGMDNETSKKQKQQALDAARAKFGAHKTKIEVSDREWEAIQRGACSDSMVMEILKNANLDTIRQKAMPKQTRAISDARLPQVKALLDAGYTTAEVANRFGVSTSTIIKYSKGK